MAVHAIHEIDLSTTLDYSRLKHPLESLLDQYQTANGVYARLGHDALRSVVEISAPDTFAAMQTLPHELDTTGVALLHNTRVNEVQDELAQLLSISLGNLLGYPTKTDRRIAQIAWPIKFDADTTATKTFSQSTGEAAFHTDTQYFPRPEKYFGLFCVVADEPGKGTNLLIDGKVAIDTFQEQNGIAMRSELEKPFPFRVPSVFTKEGNDEDVEIVWAPIYTESSRTIRYRKDTVERALTQPGVELPATQHTALNMFDALLPTLPTVRYHLQPGDGIFINNHQMLHARTEFTNTERSLYRVRMSDEEQL